MIESVADILAIIERHSQEQGGKAALVEAGGRWRRAIRAVGALARLRRNDSGPRRWQGRLTYAELQQRIAGEAERLIALGLRPGDPVLFAVRPGIAAIVLILAVAKAGGVLVAFDPGMSPAVFATRMQMIRPRLLIAESVLLALSSVSPLRRLLQHRGMNLPAWNAERGMRSANLWRNVLFHAGDPRALRFHDDHGGNESTSETHSAPGLPPSAFFVVFTSGTTAAPKAVVHDSRSIGATMRLAAEHLAIERGGVVYSDQLHLVLPGLLAGATAVMPRGRAAHASRLLTDLRRFGVTDTFLLPKEALALARLAQTRGERLPERLRTILLGSAPVYPPTLARLRSVLSPHTTVWCIYAMTELLPACRVTLDEKLAFSGDGDLVGSTFSGVDARIAADGELLLRGPNLCHGYLGEPPLVEHATGDLADIDEQGRVVLLGRKKDMIIRRHFNIYPALYEPLIERISGVRRCALVGVYDQRRADETVVLVVEAEPGVERRPLLARLRRELRTGPHAIDAAAYPDRIVIRPLPEAGRSRKVDKDRLRREFVHKSQD